MNNWKKAILKQSATMREAIDVLNLQSLRIVMIIDNEKRLVGTVTDGDIRRGLVNGMGMDSEVSEFMFTTPTTATTDESNNLVYDKMNKNDLFQIPIVDSQGRVSGLRVMQDFLKKTKYDNPVLLMAGGFGKRLYPLTSNMPKPLLKVGKKPILETILEQFVSAGFHDFYISTHYEAEKLQKHFKDGSDFGVSIQYLHEGEPLGTAGALGLLPDNLPDLPMIVMNGDLLTKIDFKALLDFHYEQEGIATVCVREYDFQVPYGVIRVEDNYVTNIEEKPVYNLFINAGVYVLNKEVISTIDGVDYLDMPQFLMSKKEQNKLISIFPVHEYWLDIGEIDQFEQAQKDIKDGFSDRE